MPVNISTIPKKRATKSKKQEETSRVYKKNNSGPDPNAPQPPSPDSDATDNDAEIESSVAANATPSSVAASTSNATASSVAASTSNATASSVVASSVAASNAAACDETSTPKSKKMKRESSYDRLEVNKLLSDLFPSKYMNEKVKALESTNATAKPSTKSSTKKRQPRMMMQLLKQSLKMHFPQRMSQ